MDARGDSRHRGGLPEPEDDVARLDSASPQEVAADGGHLDAVAVLVEQAVRSPDPDVDAACGHLLRAGGKGFRPLVTVLAAAATGHVTARTHAAAAACELLHLSTLYHDDVIDDADRRRGTSSANRTWGERVAVLAGNRLTALALEAAGRAGAPVPAVVASTYRELVEGERRECQLVGSTDHGVEAYLEVIDGKTASLIAAAARVGAVSTDAGPAHVDGLATWGRTVGQAYQIADDLLDVMASSAAAGKPTASDVRQGVFTLPLLDALDGPGGDQLRVLLAGGGPYPGPAIERVLAIVRACGAIERSATRVEELLRRADEQLEVLAPGPARQALRKLARSVVPTFAPPNAAPMGPGTSGPGATPDPAPLDVSRLDAAAGPADRWRGTFEPEPA
jgi:heptaprenyl diphosphate synthase